MSRGAPGGGLSWARALGSFSRDARLYLASAGVMGLTIFGGITSLLSNLYLLRLGYGPGFIGAVNGIGMLLWALACLPAGVVGRRWGSRTSMIVGMAVAMAGYLLLPACEIAPAGPRRDLWVIASAILANVAISLYDVNSQPFLVAVSSPAERDHLFSVQGALWPLAGFAGSLAGGAMPKLTGLLLGVPAGSPAAYRWPLLLSAGLMGLAVAALVSVRHREEAQAAPSAAPGTRGAQTLPRAELLLPVLLGLALLLQCAGEGAIRSFLNVYMDERLGTATPRIGLVAAVGQLIGAPVAMLMPALVRRWGHRGVFAAGTLGIAAAMVPVALVPTWIAAGAGSTAAVALAALARPAVLVYLMAVVPPGQRALMSGIATMAAGLSWSAVSFGGSLLIPGAGYAAFFLAAGALTAAGAATFQLTPHPKDRPASTDSA